MPDMQTALSKVLDEWDKHIEENNQTKKEDEKQMQATQEPTKENNLFRTTNNVTRATFNLIRDNAGITRKGAVAKLETMGYKPTSTTSLLTQMMRQRLVRVEADGGLHANFAEYTPLKAKLRRVMAEKRPKKVQVVKAFKVVKTPSVADAGIATLQPQATPAPRLAIITTNFDVDSIIKNLTILQAKALRDALNNLFK